ncbi:hypothetical protein N7537_007844 [Penicillium hordei]|uniref:Uncharacterized protein n=1 Tax=Penicillium hordei TaxID=40994 RepID=A0AAD6DZK4_9EURO|nr:uncharacterized protein N7537_007844 [Penicillium hordei]KAJ5597760.1 hypothetical protein N7537_007844 [Penicillium hordei]
MASILSRSLPSLHPGHLSPFTSSLQARPSISHLDRMEKARPQLSKSDFVNPNVLNTANPHPVWGYAHGPIPDNNPYWKLKMSRRGRVSRREQGLALASRRPQAPVVTLNGHITLANQNSCDISVHTGQMCGIGFPRKSRLTTHILSFHAGAGAYTHTYSVVLNSYISLAVQEKIAGDNAMKRWALMGGWRDALYLNEPGPQNVSTSLLGFYCDVLEEIGWGGELCIYWRTDAQFAAEYGTQFHQPRHREWLESRDVVIPISALILHLDLDLYLIVSKSASEVDSKPENLAEWPFDAITDIFTGLYLPLSELDAVYGPMPEEMD